MPYLEIGTTSSTLSSLTIASAGYIQFQANPATVGLVRASPATTIVAAKNNGLTNNISCLETDSSDNILIGAVTAGVRPPSTILDASTSIIHRINGTSTFTVSNAGTTLAAGTIAFSEGVTPPVFTQNTRTTDATVSSMTVRAQGAVQSGTPTNANGGTLRLQGGLARQDGTTGLRGGVRLELSSGGDVMVEAAEVAVGRRVIALNRHSAITATEVPSGDGVVYIGNVLTFPTSSPVTGAILAVSSGVVYGYNAGSLVQTLNTSLATKALTDADYTTTVAEHTRTIMEFTGTLTANRNIVVPTVSGYQWTVYNNTTGGFSLTVKTNSGTGIAVAAGKRTIVYCDGTNVVRVTPDT